MEARVAVLEQIAKSTAETLVEIKNDIRGARSEAHADLTGMRQELHGDLREVRSELRNGLDGARTAQSRDFRTLIRWMVTIGGVVVAVIGAMKLL